MSHRARERNNSYIKNKRQYRVIFLVFMCCLGSNGISLKLRISIITLHVVVVHYMLYIIYYVLHVIYYILFVICYMSFYVILVCVSCK